jgi:hypothetical protein
MALNPRYVTAPSLQELFRDKASGEPLSGGKVFFYRDTNRTQLKTVYELQGNQANYTYSPLPNPVILSSAGTMMDNNQNDIIPYYYPFDENGDVDLYYIVVQNSLGVPQFTRQAWPNPGFDNAPSSSDDRFNYIPNGQLLAHTVLQDDELLPGTNIIAQGGFTIELDATATSVNTLEFLTEQFTQAPPQSPRYLMRFTCSSFVSTETTKAIRIKWTDVNKFSTKPGTYKFGFWATSNVALPVSINLVKFFGVGGTPFVPVTQALETIATSSDATLYQFTIDFGLNNAYIVGDGQDDFVALDISLPTNIGFQASFTDFVLMTGDTLILNFPVQTDADMMARGVFGWADKVDPSGLDLYLPPILTKRGMTWDSSQIATIGMDVFPIDDPNTLQDHNKMPCDGATYIYADYAANGIPFARLGGQLIARNQALNDLPVYGTGPNYVSTLVPFSGASETGGPGVRIAYNIAGAGSPLAANGASTNITFSPMYIYGGSTTGRATLGVFSSNMGPTVVSMISMAGFQITAAANGSGFSVVPLNTATGLRAFQTPINSYAVTCPNASAMTGGVGRYITFTVSAQAYFIWFNVNGGNTVPGVGGIAIEVRISSTYLAQDVADVMREALNAFNATQLVFPAALPGTGGGIQAGSYFTFSSNPAALRNFYVWYTVNGVGVDPAPVGLTGIKVPLLSSDSAVICRDRTRGTLNSYQYQAPDFRGMFFRAADPNATWDLDAALRWSYSGHQWGILPGTFEYQQFLQHTHTPTSGAFVVQPGSPGNYGGGATGIELNAETASSGGTETRPVNTYVYPFIRY